jgi:nucleoside-diphosphate kinase
MAFSHGANVVRDAHFRQLAAPAQAGFVHRGIAAPLGAGYKAPQFKKNSTLIRGEAMTVERTFSIIKPDATERNLTGAINAVLEKSGLRIVAQKRVRWSAAEAQEFYVEHKERPFYGELVEFMTSGPIVVQVLEGENAIAKYREVIGATDPAAAAEGTVRKLFAESKAKNAVHGSDSPAAATREIGLNFKTNEIVG